MYNVLKKYIKAYRSKNGKKYNNLTSLMGSPLVSFGIDWAIYQSGDLEGTSILKLFQNFNKIFHAFQKRSWQL